MQKSRNGLITAYEVVMSAPVERSYPTSVLNNQIARIERSAFKREVLTSDFRKLLQASKQDYSAVSRYDSQTSYAQNALVNYEGAVLVSLTDANNTHPADNDLENPDWDFAPKFGNEDYNSLWDLHLKFYLACLCVYETCQFVTFKIGAKGAVVTSTDDTGISTVNHKTFVALRNGYLDAAEEEYREMLEYMKDVAAFDLMFEAVDEDVQYVKSKRRRIF